MDSKGPKMLARDFSPQSHLAQTLKDAELILREAGRCGLRLPLTSVQAELLRAAIAPTSRLPSLNHCGESAETLRSLRRFHSMNRCPGQCQNSRLRGGYAKRVACKFLTE